MVSEEKCNVPKREEERESKYMKREKRERKSIGVRHENIIKMK